MIHPVKGSSVVSEAKVDALVSEVEIDHMKDDFHKCSMDSSLVYLWGIVVILPFSLIGRMLNHSLSCVQLFVTSWTVAHQAPPSMGFSRQEYWSGLPFPSPGDLPHPGIKPRSPTLQADALTSEPCWLENRISSTTYIVCINCTPTFTAISYKLWYL